jgi:hypothetical protein
MNNSDEDFVVIGLHALIAHLTTVEQFDLPQPQNYEIFLDRVLLQITAETEELANSAFRALVLLPKVLPLTYLPIFLTKVLDAVGNTARVVQTQVLSVLREILTNSVQFEPERQAKIVATLAPRVDREIKQASESDVLLFYIDLLTYTLEFLSPHFDEEQTGQVFETIVAHLSSRFSDALGSVAGLAREWAVAASSKLLASLIKFLFELEQRTAATTVLCSMVKYRPSLYRAYAGELIAEFVERVEEQERALAAEQEEDDDELDVAGKTSYIQGVTELVTALSRIIGAFPNVGSDRVSEFTALVWRDLKFGATVIGEGDGGEIELAEEQAATSDDTWNIRKAAVALGLTLVTAYPDAFFEEFPAWEGIDMLKVIIRDGDVGVQKDAFALAGAVASAYTRRVDDEITK